MTQDYAFKTSFGSDNHSGVHPEIMAAMMAVNQSHAHAYGLDEVSLQCRDRMRTLFGQSIDAEFVFNGTAANVLCIHQLLHSHHAVICHEQAHLNKDECGAPENYIGCKLLTADSPDAKLTPELIRGLISRQGDQHCAQVKMISLTQPTEYGTVYSLDELKAIREMADQFDLYIHVDGTRLMHAANYLGCSLKDAAHGADVVSLGGTKNGLLFGEMVLLIHPDSQKDVKFKRKQMMQLSSKNRFVAAQFLRLYGEDELWKQIAAHAHDLARYIEQKCLDIDELEVVQRVQANSCFVKIPKSWTKPLKRQNNFYIYDDKNWVARWMFSFDSKRADIDAFIEFAKRLRG